MSVLAPQFERKDFRVDFPFTAKASVQKGDLVLKGYASTFGNEDRDGEVMDPHAFDDTLQKYLDLNPIILWGHDRTKVLGTMTKAKVDDVGLQVEVVIPKPVAGMSQWKFDAYNDIKRGVVRMFSVGGQMDREIVWATNSAGEIDYGVPPKIMIKRVDLYETSVVPIPANPLSMYDAAVKSAKGAGVGPVVNQEAKSQMSQLLGIEPVTSPDLKAMTEQERDHRFVELTHLYRRAGCVPPERNAWKRVQKVMEKSSRQSTIIKATIPVLMMTLGMVETGRAGNNTAEKLVDARDLVTKDIEETVPESKALDQRIDAIKELGLAIARLPETK